MFKESGVMSYKTLKDKSECTYAIIKTRNDRSVNEFAVVNVLEAVSYPHLGRRSPGRCDQLLPDNSLRVITSL